MRFIRFANETDDLGLDGPGTVFDLSTILLTCLRFRDPHQPCA